MRTDDFRRATLRARIPRRKNKPGSIQQLAVSQRKRRKNQLKNAVLTVHELFSEKIILLALARNGLAWYISKRRKRCGSRCVVQRGAGTVEEEGLNRLKSPGHLMQKPR
jgi:hypothetical protein